MDDPPSKVITQSELNRLVKQLDDLRKALLPFAKFAEALPPIIEGQPRLTDSGPAFTTAPLGENYVITFEDLRQAKVLLDRTQAEDEQVTTDNAEMEMSRVRCAWCGGYYQGQSTRVYSGMQFCT